jgi:hypothetical protein
MCGAAAAEVLARAGGVALPQVGWLRAQPPIKPIPIRLFTAESLAASAMEQSSAAAPANPPLSRQATS